MEEHKELTPQAAELLAAQARLKAAQESVDLLNREKVAALQTRLQERKNREEQERFEAQRKAEEIAAMWTARRAAEEDAARLELRKKREAEQAIEQEQNRVQAEINARKAEEAELRSVQEQAYQAEQAALLIERELVRQLEEPSETFTEGEVPAAVVIEYTSIKKLQEELLGNAELHFLDAQRVEAAAQQELDDFNKDLRRRNSLTELAVYEARLKAASEATFKAEVELKKVQDEIAMKSVLHPEERTAQQATGMETAANGLEAAQPGQWGNPGLRRLLRQEPAANEFDPRFRLTETSKPPIESPDPRCHGGK